MKHDSSNVVAEDRQSLWLLVVSPTIWAAHFLVSYIGAAVWCGKVMQQTGGIGAVRTLIIGFALIALAGIAFTGLRGWRKHTHGEGAPPYDKDTPEDRHQFLGFATVLLSALSAIAIVYVSIATLFIGSCA